MGRVNRQRKYTSWPLFFYPPRKVHLEVETTYLKKSAGHLLGGSVVDRYRFIFEHRTHWRVKEMCRVLEVSRSGFYAWKKRDPSPRQQETRRLDQAIERLY